MNRKQLIKAYIEFFKSKNHKEIPNAPLIPENDPTVLFTTAGMHPLVPYLLGQPHPSGKRLVNVQKCIRTQDIEEVGDTFHHTFFEMLGNWSVGDYFKKEAIEYSFEFLTKILKIPIEKLAVSCFEGDKEVEKDNEAAETWMKLGIKPERIAFLPRKNNWWGPAGKTGPCGPDTEMFFWKTNNNPAPKKFDSEDSNWIEIWNDVLMQYNKDEKGSYNLAKQKNVDTGMGVERTIAVLKKIEDNYLTGSFLPMIKEIEKISKRKYGKDEEETRAMRIIADHLKAAVMILAEGISPSNTEQGYVLRRLIRRAVRYGKFLMMQNNFTKKIAEKVLEIYDDYPNLQKNRQFILEQIEKEETRFRETLASGLRYFEKITKESKGTISGKDAFLLYQSYGFPIEITQELAKEKNLKVDMKSYEKEAEIHQEKSRTAAEGRFKSGLADNSEATTKLHTTTHLLAQALRQVLKKPDLHQRGSNITPERLRFDFNFDRKLTEQELKEIEELVNKKIQEKLLIKCEEMTIEQAKKEKAQGIFENKYGEKVFVYSVGEFSKEICAGPHVKNTSELGKFKILKEESSSAGVRRIKAILE
ncbi:alanine--tRNA ligase [Candidatus Woesearchaeota archaeon CG10_big_fil_rev_8_21_14_0_10_34_12]|nr:MAG: alanine--tRNA ligase [Candidatus Woesearchaeota archaeon CG10_big_fil_rev_8_21_14_0_10_34_12]